MTGGDGIKMTKVGHNYEASVKVDNDSIVINADGDLEAAGKVSDVVLNGTSLVVDKIATIPVSTGGNLGVVSTHPAYGVVAGANGRLSINRAVDADIEAKTDNMKPLTSISIDKLVKTGITTNTIALTDEEKLAAQE